MYNDYRKLRVRNGEGTFHLSHVDEFIDEMLTKDFLNNIALPRLPTRWTLEASTRLEPRISALEDFEEELEVCVHITRLRTRLALRFEPIRVPSRASTDRTSTATSLPAGKRGTHDYTPACLRAHVTSRGNRPSHHHHLSHSPLLAVRRRTRLSRWRRRRRRWRSRRGRRGASWSALASGHAVAVSFKRTLLKPLMHFKDPVETPNACDVICIAGGGGGGGPLPGPPPRHASGGGGEHEHRSDRHREGNSRGEHERGNGHRRGADDSGRERRRDDPHRDDRRDDRRDRDDRR